MPNFLTVQHLNTINFLHKLNFKIKNKSVGSKSRTFIIAEISANHTQSFKKARKLIYAAKYANADAIKLQTFKPESLAIKGNQDGEVLKKTKQWKNFKNRYELFKKAYLPWEWHGKLFKLAKKLKIPIFSSPFDNEAVNLLQKLKCPAYKIASPEITDLNLIDKVAKTKKPVIISLGLAEKKDILLALNVLKKRNNIKFSLLKCLSHYPANPRDLNLKSIKLLEKTFKCPIGFSDHTLGSASSVTAVNFGAKIIEKHLKLKGEKKSLDAFFSMDQFQFKKMVEDIRIAETASGIATFKIDKKTRQLLKGRRSLYVSKNIKKGEKFSNKNIRSVRPFNGLHTKYLHKIIGKKAKKFLKTGQPLSLNYISR